MNFLVRTGEAYWNYVKAAFNPYLLLAGILILAFVLGIIFIISAIERYRSKKKR
ncbi:hypothetical protein ES703_08208 [subsurface metagenome]